MLISASHKQPGSLPAASGSISVAKRIQLMPNWCTNPVTEYCSTVESAQSKHGTRVINELPLKQGSGAGLTEHLWGIDQGEGEHTPERRTFGLKQHCFLIWWHFKWISAATHLIPSPSLLFLVLFFLQMSGLHKFWHHDTQHWGHYLLLDGNLGA